ncbi:MarR family winged helix-turn-helix transcriptional regulator [Gryllotalpicola ginsengisoli]|uniref:MarR family winged helix-turn-helix transcriptional regulator n=1 Tax=Gryllotalpicola ginsengisoli TaxID=444608 RepID=UPI0003B7A89F|nr:MarR family transcriptional regulator [Gryllotalpicola ginsengisoli]
MASTTERTADLGWSLGTLLRGYLKLSADALGELPGGQRGYQVLSIAGSGSCSNQAEIAETTGLDRTVLTYLIDDLEKAGLVVRTPDPRDRRARRVSLTDAGTKRLRTLTTRMREVEEQLLSGLSDAEADTLRSIVARAAQSLDEQPEEVCQLVDSVSSENGAAGGR